MFINEIFNKNKSKKNLVENSRIGFEILDSEILEYFQNKQLFYFGHP